LEPIYLTITARAVSSGFCFAVRTVACFLQTGQLTPGLTAIDYENTARVTP
jgi:hypothetical protein